MAVRVLTAALAVAMAMAVVVAVAVAGCGGTRLLVRTTAAAPTRSTTTVTVVTPPAPLRSPTSLPSSTSSRAAAAARYVAQLRGEEQTLAAAERRIPSSAPTPRALSRSASLLAGAVSRMATGLAAITPPAAVASDHAQLVSVVRAYAGQLRRAAGLARRRGGRVQAGSLLVSATGRASSAFSATLSKIYSTLGVRQP
jgi:hypothetical protein